MYLQEPSGQRNVSYRSEKKLQGKLKKRKQPETNSCVSVYSLGGQGVRTVGERNSHV